MYGFSVVIFLLSLVYFCVCTYVIHLIYKFIPLKFFLPDFFLAYACPRQVGRRWFREGVLAYCNFLFSRHKMLDWGRCPTSRDSSYVWVFPPEMSHSVTRTVALDCFVILVLEPHLLFRGFLAVGAPSWKDKISSLHCSWYTHPPCFLVVSVLGPGLAEWLLLSRAWILRDISALP